MGSVLSRPGPRPPEREWRDGGAWRHLLLTSVPVPALAHVIAERRHGLFVHGTGCVWWPTRPPYPNRRCCRVLRTLTEKPVGSCWVGLGPVGWVPIQSRARDAGAPGGRGGAPDGLEPGLGGGPGGEGWPSAVRPSGGSVCVAPVKPWGEFPVWAGGPPPGGTG